jgi:hypothetical protein
METVRMKWALRLCPITSIGDMASAATTVDVTAAENGGAPQDLGTVTVPALAAGSIDTLSVTLTGGTAGSYVITATVTAVPGEANTANNIGSVDVTVAPTGPG